MILILKSKTFFKYFSEIINSNNICKICFMYNASVSVICFIVLGYFQSDELKLFILTYIFNVTYTFIYINHHVKSPFIHFIYSCICVELFYVFSFKCTIVFVFFFLFECQIYLYTCLFIFFLFLHCFFLVIFLHFASILIL